MKILILSDLHAHNDVLDKMDDIFAKSDAVLFAGDFAACFKPETGKEALLQLWLLMLLNYQKMVIQS